MTEDRSQDGGNPLIVIGDKIQPKPQDVFEDLVDVLSRLDISEHLWELIDFKTFFKLCYLTSPKIKSASIAFLQQTA